MEDDSKVDSNAEDASIESGNDDKQQNNDGGQEDAVVDGVDTNDGDKSVNGDNGDKAALWESWREDMAGEDASLQKLLSRYNTPSDFAKKTLELQKKLSSGEYKRNIEPPVDDPDELAKWRKDNGIPLEPVEYELPDGIVLGEEDKPLIDDFLKIMHDNNVSSEVPKAAIEWYYKAEEARHAKVAEEDSASKAETEEVLREQLGREYLPVTNMARNFANEEFGELVADALMSQPESAMALANIARRLNPTITVVPNASNPVQAISDEISELKEQMKDVSAWSKNKKGQERYVELLMAQNQMNR